MLKSYLKIAWRNLMKNKVFSFINITGLTIGITVCMMIFLFIMNEFSVDNFHKNGDLIYRVMRGYDKSKPRVAYLSGPYAPALINDFPNQIKKVIRIGVNDDLVTFGNKAFHEKHVYDADEDFFTFFSFPLLIGNPQTVLKEPGSIVLTETTAKKYFGTAGNAMNKIMDVDKSLHLKVTGIAKNPPSNSHLSFDLVIPLSNYSHQDGFNVWINNNYFTYVLLDKQSSKEVVEKQLPAFIEKYMGKDMAAYGFHFDLALTPLKDIYFENPSVFDNVKHGDKKVVYIFLSIAVLILLIACINFMNLSTIRAVERSKEVGLRKVMGALRNNLVWQFIGESILLTCISCALAIGILLLVMPFYNQLLGYDLTVSWNSWPIYLFLVSVIIIAGFLAGSYPAFFLSAFSPIQALKGKLKLGKGGSVFRQSLVVLQFSISVFLIIGTFVIMMQMKYVKNKDLGYDESQTLVVPIDNDDIYKHRLIFKNELQAQPGISSVSLMSGEPGGFFDMFVFSAQGKNGENFKIRTEFADFEYVKTLGLKIIAGRDFSSSFPTDTANAVLINRTAAGVLGWTPEEAVGKEIKNNFRDTSYRKIAGVVEDFNFLSLKEKMDGLVIAPNDDRRVFCIKIKPGNIPSTIKTISDIYSSVAPVYPFEFSFLDQKFDKLYKTDIRQQTILSVFSGLAIFIACLGLFGLASFTATKRTKEIGVRKVLGSSTGNIVFLLSRDLLKPVLIATCIAIPVGYSAMNSWLNNFAYRTPLHWWVFVLAAMITVIIALFTVSFKALKAGLANPTTSLRSE
ncbi:MAG TPA: ABC transporter permease [Puia sp.]|jgi:putative ABC transport system permease protein|nr:ABC transporter permease [Puia sp.]